MNIFRNTLRRSNGALKSFAKWSPLRGAPLTERMRSHDLRRFGTPASGKNLLTVYSNFSHYSTDADGENLPIWRKRQCTIIIRPKAIICSVVSFP